MSSVKEKLAAGEAVFGMLTAAASPQIIEVCGWLGYDFVMLDMEHGDGIDVSSALPLIRAADATGIEVLARIARLDTAVIQALLDCGVTGICLSHVQTREDAEQLGRATKYPPDGDRSMNPFIRAAEWLTTQTWDEFWPKANSDILVMAIVEEAAGMENLEEIASAPGLDVLWIGTGDLSQSLGIPFGSPELVAAAARGLDAAQRNGVASYATLASAPTVDRETRQRLYKEQYDAGYRMFMMLDSLVFLTAFKELLSAVREA